jgi:putative YhbY family RNA-binding protein
MGVHPRLTEPILGHQLQFLMPSYPSPDSEPATPGALTLTSAERSALRARAHDLSPVVMVGDAGLTDGVAAETDRALSAPGLIKVRVSGDDRGARAATGEALAERLGCALVQVIGKLVVLWRPVADDTPSRAPIRRRTIVAPKKLAAEGKAAPARRARPGVPKTTGAKPGTAARSTTGSRPARAGPARVGPGSRTTRGALDPSVTPVTRGANKDAPPAKGAGPSAAGKKVSSDAPARATLGAPRRSGARPAAATPRARPSTSGTARPGSRSRGSRREP